LKPNRKYAIETRYLGPEEDAPWKGWVVTRTYPNALLRDKHLNQLAALQNPSWEYRIKTGK
jgi:hypothetical protein